MWTPDLVARFKEACDAQGGIHLCKAKRTFAQMECKGEEGAPTQHHVQTRISNLRRDAEIRRTSASSRQVICLHPGCDKSFSRPSHCLEHCKKTHPVWLKGLPRGNYCELADKEAVDELKAKAKAKAAEAEAKAAKAAKAKAAKAKAKAAVVLAHLVAAEPVHVELAQNARVA